MTHINGNGHGNSILSTFVERQGDVISANVLKHARGRAAEAAQALSRRGALQAICELANEAVSKTITLCFEVDTDGYAANVDHVTGRVLVPVAWGRAGGALYGLRRSEQIVLNAYMRKLHNIGGNLPPLFLFDAMNWYLNIFDYADLNGALNYWKVKQLNVTTYRKIAQSLAKR